jgi:hypothetical protein
VELHLHSPKTYSRSDALLSNGQVFVAWYLVVEHGDNFIPLPVSRLTTLQRSESRTGIYSDQKGIKAANFTRWI